MITGLSRSIRSETLLKFAILDLDAKIPLSGENTVKAIMGVFKAAFGAKATEDCELEFMERKGAFFTPRIINDSAMNEYVHKRTTSSILELTPFIKRDRPLKMVIKTPSALETLHFVDQSTDESLPDDQVELQVKAIGMNPRDISVAMRQLDSFEFGSECSGVVTGVGCKVRKFSIGDRIACISVEHGVYSTYTRSKAAFSFKIKEEISFEAAASIPVAYCTAQYGLVDLGRIKEGETILIHGAESALGQAVVALAQAIGAQVFAMVKNAENKEVLMKAFGLNETKIYIGRIKPAHKGCLMLY
jgi:hypothetical protein